MQYTMLQEFLFILKLLASDLPMSFFAEPIWLRYLR